LVGKPEGIKGLKNTMQGCRLEEFGTGEGQVWAVVNPIMNLQVS